MVAATRRGYRLIRIKKLLGPILEQTHLCYSDDFSICAPTSLFKILRYLGGLPRASLPHDYQDLAGLNEVEYALAMFCYGQERSRLVQRRYESRVELELSHIEMGGVLGDLVPSPSSSTAKPAVLCMYVSRLTVTL